MIEGKHLTKAFEKQIVLQNVSFTIPDDTVVGLYGASGIGKSTLANLLCGTLRPDAGEILLDGVPLVSPTLPYDRNHGLAIQMVFQQPHAALDPSQKIGAGFRELIRVHRFASSKAEEAALIERLFASVGLTPDLGEHLPHQISGGEAQRICIARCLLFQPRLLILDEATSMLDMSTQANVLGLVRRAMQSIHGSILLITHDRALVEHLSDRIYCFDKQQLKEE